MGPMKAAAFVALQAASAACDTDAMWTGPQQKWGLSSVKEGAHELGHSVSEGAGDLGHTVSEGAHKLGHSALGHSVSEGAHKLGRSATEGAKDLAKSAEEGAHRLGHSAEEGAADLGHAVEEGAKDLAEDPLVQSAEERAEDLRHSAEDFVNATKDKALSDLGHAVEEGAKDLAEDPLVQSAEERAKDLGRSAEDFVNATKDKALREAASAVGLCEQRSGEEASESEHEPVDTVGCEIVAEGVATAALTSRIKGIVATTVVKKLSESLVRRASKALCESSHDWLAKHHALKVAKPMKYVVKLRTQLRKRVGPVLDKYSAKFCDRLEEELFADTGPAAPRKAAATLLVAFAGGVAGFALVTVRLARRAARGAMQPVPEESSEEA